LTAPLKRGDLYWIDFDPATGAEMANWHPALVIQNDVENQHSSLTVVVAITSNLRAAKLPVCVLLPAGSGGLSRDSVAHCGHVYTVDQRRLSQRIGSLPQEMMDQVNAALRRSLEL
jgi:mRNA interferase MazF